MSIGSDELFNTKFLILDILNGLEDCDLKTIEQWIRTESYKKDLEKFQSVKKSQKQLKIIGKTIKKYVPFHAEMLTETIVPPAVGDQADCNVVNTCHIDGFLYDDDEVEDLVKEGKLHRHYCINCSSRNIKDLTFTSHSMSRETVSFMFKVLLPPDLMDKQILDVGSRLGAIIFGAYKLSNASTIIGVEMNKELCEVQNAVITEHAMDTNRIKVIHSDVTEIGDIVNKADITIINVLDFFVDIDKHKQMWYFFKKVIKKGSYLVCNRSMVSTLNALDIYEDFMGWLNVCRPCQLKNEIYFNTEDVGELYLYSVCM